MCCCQNTAVSESTNMSAVLHQASAHPRTVCNHPTDSTYTHHISPPEIRSDNVRAGKGWNERDSGRRKEENRIEQSQNSTRRNTAPAHLPVRDSGGTGWACCLAHQLSPLAFLSPAACVLQDWMHRGCRVFKASVPLWAKIPLKPLRTPGGISALFQRETEEKFHRDGWMRRHVKVGQCWRKRGASEHKRELIDLCEALIKIYILIVNLSFMCFFLESMTDQKSNIQALEGI